MIIQSASQMAFGFLGNKQVIVKTSNACLTSDAGLLPLRQLDDAIGLTGQFADALYDPRRSRSVTQTFPEMVRTRIYGILADYPDQNDHDLLRSDPIFKLIANRSPTADDLASQPTLSRFENAIDVPSLNRLRDVFIDQFIASFDEPPRSLTLDIDPFDDPTHGQQQLSFFHGYYSQYQYLPRAITCEENDMVVMICLLFGTAHAALGADDDLEYLVTRLREAFPGVRIHLRADSGFGTPTMYRACEHLAIDYTIGIGMNAVLKKNSDNLLNLCVEQFEQTGETQREFCAFYYRAGSWLDERWVIVKVEVNRRGTNRRAVVSNRPGALVLPEAAYDAYSDRGESENRNKELKCGLMSDRLSDHRYMANLFRLYLHSAAYNLLVRVRNLVADPPPVPEEAEVPVEALTGAARRDYFNRRRRRDPLGEGQPCTWRTRLIKVAARVTVSSRRVLVELSSSWPYQSHYHRVSEQVLAFCNLSFDSS
jgi:hypothetical protein